MNGSHPGRTAELLLWIAETFEVIADDIAADEALDGDLKTAMGLMGILRLDTREEVKMRARELDTLCRRELEKREKHKERALLERLEAAVASLVESSGNVAEDIDSEILAELGERSRDLKRPWIHRWVRRLGRRLLRPWA